VRPLKLNLSPASATALQRASQALPRSYWSAPRDTSGTLSIEEHGGSSWAGELSE
jgi:hypothetical protein